MIDRATHWHDTEASATRNYCGEMLPERDEDYYSADRSRL